MSKICPAIKASCRYFDGTIKNRCGIKRPYVGTVGKKFYCKSHSCSKEIKDMGMFSLITEGTRKA
jgi:hypothetical protein